MSVFIFILFRIDLRFQDLLTIKYNFCIIGLVRHKIVAIEYYEQHTSTQQKKTSTHSDPLRRNWSSLPNQTDMCTLIAMAW